MSVKRTRNNRWQARWRDPLGHQRAKTFELKADAIAHERRVTTDRDAGTYIAPTAGATPLAVWADQWLAGAMNLAGGTIDTYRRDLDRHILPVLGDIRLRALTPERIETFLAAELRSELAPSSVHRHYRTVRRCLQVAVDRGMLARNPCDPIEPPRVPRSEMMFLTAEQVEQLAGAISDRYRSWVLIAAYGGLRWSEAVGLRRRDIDEGRITVTEQLIRRAGGAWERTEPKTRAGRRVITLPETVVGEVDEHLGRWAQPGPDGLVFPNRGGRPLNGPSFRGNVFAPACVRAGVTPVPRIHDLRHTAAALMVQAGAHPKAMQVRMGHSSIMVTLDRYGHLFPEMDAELAVRLDDLRPHLRIVA